MSNAVTAFMNPTSLAEAREAAEVIAKSGMVPQAYDGNVSAVLVAGQMAAELGVSWMQGIQGIAVINGHPSVYGDLAKALVLSHPDFEYMKETYDEDTLTATCRVKRRGQPEVVQSFSWAEACQADLHGKDTYQKYRRRMLQMRARSWAQRDCIPEALKGFKTVDEALDIVNTDDDLETRVEAHAAADTGYDKLEAALAISGPKHTSEQPQGSPEWWADVIHGAATIAKLEQIGFELRAADQETREAMREVFTDRAKQLRAELNAATAETNDDNPEVITDEQD